MSKVYRGGSSWALVWLLAVLPFLGFWMYGLFDIDEGFYGAVVAEMNRRHEWLTPYYNGHPWFEKPILLYWVSKPLVSWEQAPGALSSAIWYPIPLGSSLSSPHCKSRASS